MGAGKTLTMSILASYLAKKLGVPLYSNYSLQNSQKITSLEQLWKIDSAIFCFDEIWLTLDARLWKDNTILTRWVNQTRKKKMIVFYTTQHVRQVELRVRNATDVLIYCDKKPNEGHWLQFIDYQYQQLGKKYLLYKPEAFYPLYNTFEICSPIEFKEKKRYATSNTYKRQNG